MRKEENISMYGYVRFFLGFLHFYQHVSTRSLVIGFTGYGVFTVSDEGRSRDEGRASFMPDELPLG